LLRPVTDAVAISPVDEAGLQSEQMDFAGVDDVGPAITGGLGELRKTADEALGAAPRQALVLAITGEIGRTITAADGLDVFVEERPGGLQLRLLLAGCGRHGRCAEGQNQRDEAQAGHCSLLWEHENVACISRRPRARLRPMRSLSALALFA